eukprot:4098317-Pyramimonas_sp.AAC.1
MWRPDVARAQAEGAFHYGEALTRLAPRRLSPLQLAAALRRPTATRALLAAGENIRALPASDWSVVRIYPRFLRLIGPS